MMAHFWRELLMLVLGVIVGSITTYTILATDDCFDDEDDEDDEDGEDDT